MPRYSTAFGMDVHLRSTTVCALDAETGEAVTRRFRGNPWGEVAEWMSGFPGPSLAAYESGYLGFAPQRELSALGVDCVVAAAGASQPRCGAAAPLALQQHCRSPDPRSRAGAPIFLVPSDWVIVSVRAKTSALLWVVIGDVLKRLPCINLNKLR